MLVKEGHETELYETAVKQLKPLVLIKRDLARKKLKASPATEIPGAAAFPTKLRAAVAGAMAIAAGVWGRGMRILLEAKS